MNELSKSFIEIKNSKFYGYLYKVSSIKEIEEILELLKKDNKKAKHIVYAYKIGPLEKKYEDKEPSGSAGLPLLNIIKFKNFDSVLIVVVRYFGGTLLGKGTLTRSYLKCASELIKEDIIQLFQ